MKFKGIDFNEEQNKTVLPILRACTPVAKPSSPEHTTLPKKKQVLPMATPSVPGSLQFQTVLAYRPSGILQEPGRGRKDASRCAEQYSSLPFLSKKCKCLLLASFIFRWIFEQLLKGAESLWQAILISYSLYKHAAIKTFSLHTKDSYLQCTTRTFN